MRDEDKVKQLIDIAADGAAFYAHASEKIDDPALRSEFADMGRHKREFAEGLRQTLQIVDGAPHADGTLSGAFRRAYADILAMVGDKRDAYVSQLEETEDRLLAHLREAIEDVEDPRTSAALKSHLPRIAACHDRMRTLKARLNA